jgi:hypothetical protein
MGSWAVEKCGNVVRSVVRVSVRGDRVMRLFVLFGYDVMLLWCGSEEASANVASTLHHSVSFHTERRSDSIEQVRRMLLV